MADITKTKYIARSIAKAEDFNFGESSAIDNLSILLNYLTNSTKDFIIQGTVQERGTPSMNVDITTLLGMNKTTGNLFHYGSTYGPVAITNGGAQNRIDTLEVRQLETDYDEKTRAHKDPATGAISYLPIDTKTRIEIEVQILQGTEGAGVAPASTSGWVKLAEIDVDAGESTAIYDADIHNITATTDGGTNTAWTTGTTDTYILKGLTEIKSILRAKHSETGDHENDVIQGQHIDWGTGANQVDADILPLGTAVTSSPTGGTATNLANSSFVRAALQEVFNRLKDMSGVANDSVDSRHYNTDSIDDEHINWGTGANQVSAGDMPIADAGSIITATEVEGALQENRTAINLNTTHRSSNGTDHTYIDQDVKTTAEPIFESVYVETLYSKTISSLSQAGSVLNISGINSGCYLCALNSTDVVFANPGSATIQTYRFNGSTWSTLGSSYSLSSPGRISITKLNSTDIAYLDGNNDSLTTLRFNGSSWSQVGSTLSVTTTQPYMTALSSVKVVIYVSPNLNIYQFSGSAWSLLDSTAITHSGACPLVAIDSTTIILANDISSTPVLQTYRYIDSDWVKIGNDNTLDTSGSPICDMKALNTNDILYVDCITEKIQAYRFDGFNINRLSLDFSLPSMADTASPTIAVMEKNKIAYIDNDDSNEDLTVYDISYSELPPSIDF